MENDQPNYYNTELEPIFLTEGGGDDNEDHELNSFLQELIYPEPGCIDTLMNPNPNHNPNPNLGRLEDWPAVEVVQPKNGGDGIIVHDQPSSMESSSAEKPISRSNLCDSPMMVQAARVSDSGPSSLASSVDAGGNPMKKDQPSNPTRKKPIVWTVAEHSAFLLGLRDGFSGDWKNMSKLYVTRRSPTQIASHAQKYFKRQQRGNPKRRKSINDITLSNIKIPQQPTAAAAPPSFYNIRQSGSNSLPQPNPNPNPNPNPKWVVPVGTQLPLPPRPVECNLKVEEARLYMARHRYESSSSSSSYIPHVPVLSPLPQQIPEFHAQNMWRRRSSSIEHCPHHHHQPQTLASSWPLQQHDYRSYNNYYSSSMPMMFNHIDLALQQSLCSLDMINPVNDTSQLTFNADMAPPPPLQDQDSKNGIFYP